MIDNFNNKSGNKFENFFLFNISLCSTECMPGVGAYNLENKHGQLKGQFSNSECGHF